MHVSDLPHCWQRTIAWQPVRAAAGARHAASRRPTSFRQAHAQWCLCMRHVWLLQLGRQIRTQRTLNWSEIITQVPAALLGTSRGCSASSCATMRSPSATTTYLYVHRYGAGTLTVATQERP